MKSLHQAVRMVKGYIAARTRESASRTADRQRMEWTASGWLASLRWNSFRTVGLYNVVVFLKGYNLKGHDKAQEIWSFRVTNLVTEDSDYSQKTYISKDEAKRASFDAAMMWAKAQPPQTEAEAEAWYRRPGSSQASATLRGEGPSREGDMLPRERAPSTRH